MTRGSEPEWQRHQSGTDARTYLGRTARDTITQFTGTVISVTFWHNGCVRVGIQPRELREGKPIDAHVFDVEQLEIQTAEPAPPPPKPKGGDDRPTIGRAPDPR